MDFDFRVDPATGLGHVDIRGEVVVDDLRRLMEAAWHDPAYAAVERAVWNFAGAWTALRTENLLQFGEWFAAHKAGRGAKIIAVIAPDDVVFGVGRVFDALQHGEGWSIGLFREAEPALQWLEAQAGG
ncbi:MAG TPA: hypothetical protein VFV84_04010 [Burkholderiales bacterium]|nr:hypothetical protein [Burkholderiales bacterium]